MKNRCCSADASNLKVSYRLKKNKFQIDIFGINYSVSYPPGFFSSLNLKARKNLAANFIYSRTAALGIAFNQAFHYQFPAPGLRNFLDWGLWADLPRISEDLGLPTKELRRALTRHKNRKSFFLPAGGIGLIKPKRQTDAGKVIIALSMGKDSLLSYGLIKELGLKYQIVSVDDEIEKFDSTDYRFKRRIFSQFCREQKERVHFLKDDVDFKDKIDRLIKNKTIRDKAEDLEHANAMPAFLLELLPFAYRFGARYIVLGNEKNFDDFFINRFGAKAYPSVDQTAAYAKKENLAFKKLTGDNLQALSLIEPIYNLAEMRILYHRYPRLLKYLMSCSPEQGDTDKWCYHCPMCAKAFLYSVAVGGDPKQIGFKKNFFDLKYRELYPLTAKRISRYYEKPPAVRAEQLLAFLLAYRQGAAGGLIDLFKEKYLREAVQKEKYLRKKFFGIARTLNIPPALKRGVLKIYQEELKNLI